MPLPFKSSLPVMPARSVAVTAPQVVLPGAAATMASRTAGVRPQNAAGVAAGDSAEAAPAPTPFTARTWNRWTTPLASFVTVCLLVPAPALGTAVQAPYPPPPTLALTSQPVTATPPSLPAVQDRVTAASPSLEVRSVGCAGTVAVGEPLATAEAAPSPVALFAVTRTVYVVSAARPVMTALVTAPPSTVRCRTASKLWSPDLHCTR